MNTPMVPLLLPLVRTSLLCSIIWIVNIMLLYAMFAFRYVSVRIRGVDFRLKLCMCLRQEDTVVVAWSLPGHNRHSRPNQYT